MAPENEARPQAAFYDHESEEPRRRRRPAADWGVGEDIFDRMPSRFARRGVHRDDIVVHRAEDERPSRSREVASWGEDAWADDAPAPRDARVAREASWDEEARDTWGDEDRAPRHGNTRVTRDASWGEEPGGVDTRAARSASWGDEPRGGNTRAARGDEPRGGNTRAARGDEPRGVDTRAARSASRGDADARDTWGDEDRAPRADAGREVESWHKDDDEPDFGGHMLLAEKPQVDSWMDDAPLVPGESRTIVLGTDESVEPVRHEEQVKERRTVVISGHPDRVPAVRAQRPPRSAVERIGTSPDRIVAYAVALGFLLVLIAVLTTGQ